MRLGTAERIEDEQRDDHYGRDASGELCGCLRAPADVEGLCAPCARELDAWVRAQAAADRAALLAAGPAAFGAPARLLPSGTVRCVAWTMRPTWRAFVRALRRAAPPPDARVYTVAHTGERVVGFDAYLAAEAAAMGCTPADLCAALALPDAEVPA